MSYGFSLLEHLAGNRSTIQVKKKPIQDRYRTNMKTSMPNNPTDIVFTEYPIEPNLPHAGDTCSMFLKDSGTDLVQLMN